MFQSVRWRLIFSFISLALLTLIVAGFLAFWAALKYIEKLETNQLKRNGEAIAEQAYPYLESYPSNSNLVQLVQATSYFGEMQVTILDPTGEVLIDSGTLDKKDLYTWLFITPTRPTSRSTGIILEDWFLGITGTFPPEFFDKLSDQNWQDDIYRRPGAEITIPQEILRSLPDGTSFSIIQRSNSAWGTILTFGYVKELEQSESKPSPEMPEIDLGGEQRFDNIQRAFRKVRVPVGDEEHPLGFVELSRASDFGSQALITFRQALMVAAIGAILVAILTGWFTGGKISAPLVALTDKTAQMSAGNLAIRADVSGKDEIAQLATQFNLMAEQLETSFTQLKAERDALRHFIADASHEMRTPITALKNFNELLLDAAGENPEVQAEFLLESKAQIERLAWLTQNLLDLSRLDAGIVELNIQPNNVSDIIDTVKSGYERILIDKNLSVRIIKSEKLLEVYCDRERIEIALSNVLENAIIYSPSGGIIEISAFQVGESVNISVSDKGPGIHQEDLPHIFDRFFRGEHHSQPGSGLGLAITKSIMEAHGGRIDVYTKPGAGAEFTLILPVEPPITPDYFSNVKK